MKVQNDILKAVDNSCGHTDRLLPEENRFT